MSLSIPMLIVDSCECKLPCPPQERWHRVDSRLEMSFSARCHHLSQSNGYGGATVNKYEEFRHLLPTWMTFCALPESTYLRSCSESGHVDSEEDVAVVDDTGLANVDIDVDAGDCGISSPGEGGDGNMSKIHAAEIQRQIRRFPSHDTVSGMPRWIHAQTCTTTRKGKSHTILVRTSSWTAIRRLETPSPCCFFVVVPSAVAPIRPNRALLFAWMYTTVLV
mmetsp:Transcript_22482/g.62734  ORF Transcript_22482/g.62734 Transcript_22482/m.62734 type:complete len:221 (+) Transcript_22482:875-1537(+)